jgi:hypothetical protein
LRISEACLDVLSLVCARLHPIGEASGDKRDLTRFGMTGFTNSDKKQEILNTHETEILTNLRTNCRKVKKTEIIQTKDT